MYGINIRLNKSANLYQASLGFINMKQGTFVPDKKFKLRFYNVYETSEISFGENIL